MKKLSYILFLFIIFLGFKYSILAEKFECVMKSEDGVENYWWNNKSFKLIFDLDEKTIRGNGTYGGGDAIDAIGDLGVNREYDSGYFIDFFEEKCPNKVYVCKFTYGLNNWFAVIFQDTLVSKIANTKYLIYRRGDFWSEMFENEESCNNAHGSEDCSHSFFRWGGIIGSPTFVKVNDKDTGCGRFFYDPSSSGELSEQEFKCDFYKDKAAQMKSLVSQYNSCKSGLCNSSNIVSNYNKLKDELKSFCKGYISIMRVGDSCMDACLNLDDHLKTDGALLFDKKVNEKCSMSEDIVSMIYNVFKWLRYIAPVLVIILSIIDFIKAIAAQNDDDMKKAQGKFVKRLIVAALLFLIPLIINFALKTFGFYHSGCDITDLF